MLAVLISFTLRDKLNTQKSHENLRRLAVARTPVKDHQLRSIITKTGQILEPNQRAEKDVEPEGDGYTNHSWSLCNSLQEPGKEAEGSGERGRINIIHTSTLLTLTAILRRALES